MELPAVRPAYQQIADELRARVLDDRLPPGSRLPNEVELAANIGVSRATVREALRTLAAEGVISTRKGPGGGSVVCAPTADSFADSVSARLGLICRVERLELDEFMESRRVLEVPAARLAADRRDDDDLDRLQQAVPSTDQALGSVDRYHRNRDFHFALVEVCHNRLLAMAAQPVFLVLQTQLDRSRLGAAFHVTVTDHHEGITEAVAAGDGEAAAQAMEEHLDWLHVRYRRAWRQSAS